MNRVLIALLGVLVATGTHALAAKPKAPAKAGAAPAASSKELEKLRGEFTWGMNPDEVLVKMVQKIEASFQEKIDKTANDPTKQDRVRKEMHAEIEVARKHSLVKFDGKTTGYDASIIDQEFTHRAGESMLVAKEESASRYFFFVNDRLYKMFIAFDKEILQGKGFQEFGKLMQARFGKAREVHVEAKTKSGAFKKLDHYLWGAKSGDALRLVDRSGFYGVFCLVMYDGKVEDQQLVARKANAKGEKTDALVEAVTAGGAEGRDPNDDVVNSVTGGPRKPAAATAPAGTPVRAPTPEESNRPDTDEDSGKDKKPKGKAGKGLEL